MSLAVADKKTDQAGHRRPTQGESMKSRIEVLLCAWAKWAAAGHLSALGYAPVSPMFRDAPSGRGYGSAPPPGIGCGELVAVDQAVNALPQLLKLIVIESYLIGGSLREVAIRCGCTQTSIARYLVSAYERLDEALNKSLTTI